jgi:HEAT repeat protein
VWFFKPNVDKLSTSRDIPGLIEALGDGDRTIRTAAGEALTTLGVPALEALTAALRHKSAAVRRGAADALGNARIRATEALTAALNDDANPAVRGAVAHAIGQARDVACAPALVAALCDVPEVSALAREALAGMGPAAVEPLIAGLLHEKRRVRESSASLLGEIADARAFKPLLAALADEDPVVVEHATLAVERFRRTQDGLIADLGNPTLDVRRSVAKALDELGWEPTPDEYGAAYWAVKCRWEECLRIGLPAVTPLIRAILGIAKPGEVRDEERRAAAMTLGALGQPAIQPVLAAAEIAPDREVMDALLQSLAFVTDPRAVDELVAVLDAKGYGRHYAARALAQIGDARAVASLGNALTDARGLDQVRIDAAKALGAIRDPGGVEPLLAILSSGAHRPEFESIVVAALAAIGDRRACAPVIETMFRQPRNDYGWRPWSEALRPLFDEFTDCIVDIAGFVVVEAGDRREVLGYRDEVFWSGSTLKFLTDRNLTAVASLCNSNTPVTTNLLHQIQDTLALKSNYPGAAVEFKRDFDPLKQLAAEELERRGRPPYDPFAYLDAAAWKQTKATL